MIAFFNMLIDNNTKDKIYCLPRMFRLLGQWLLRLDTEETK